MRECQIVLLGAGASGKSALAVRYVADTFVEVYEPTIEDSYRKMVHLDGKAYALDILDTAGIDQFTAMRELYIRNSEAFVLVYSPATPSSLQELRGLYDQVTRIKDNHKVPLVLVASKCDDSACDLSLGRAQAARWGVPFFATSAKNDLNVSQVFESLVKNVSHRDSALGSSLHGSSIFEQSVHSETSRLKLRMKRSMALGRKSLANLRPRNHRSLRQMVSAASLRMFGRDRPASSSRLAPVAPVQPFQEHQFRSQPDQSKLYHYPEPELPALPEPELPEPNQIPQYHSLQDLDQYNSLAQDLEEPPDIPTVEEKRCIVM